MSTTLIVIITIAATLVVTLPIVWIVILFLVLRRDERSAAEIEQFNAKEWFPVIEALRDIAPVEKWLELIPELRSQGQVQKMRMPSDVLYSQMERQRAEQDRNRELILRQELEKIKHDTTLTENQRIDVDRELQEAERLRLEEDRERAQTELLRIEEDRERELAARQRLEFERSATNAKEDYAIVRTFYGTDRRPTDYKSPGKIFGSDRGEFSTGICEVSIPRDHRMGELEAPTLFRFEIRKKPDKHVVLLDVLPLSDRDFYREMSRKVEASDSNQAFVFIHGYNTSFEDAARRTAQMAYDLAFDGPAVFFSWPSKASFSGYPADEATIEWAIPHLQSFLEEIVLNADVSDLHVIAHSMGNRCLTRALVAIAQQGQDKIKGAIRQIILAAPDIDKDVFIRDIAPRLSEFGTRPTLYASSRDKALIASKKFHQYPRAGDSEQRPVTLDSIDSIDATNVDTSFVGHSYYAESRSVISDIFYLLRDGLPPNERFGLEFVTDADGNYWRMKA